MAGCVCTHYKRAPKFRRCSALRTCFMFIVLCALVIALNVRSTSVQKPRSTLAQPSLPTTLLGLLRRPHSPGPKSPSASSPCSC